MEQTALVTVISIAGVVSSGIFGYVGYLKGTKKDSYSAGTEKGTIKADLAYLVKCVDNILVEQRISNQNFNALDRRVTRVEESAKSAHKRIDCIEEKG